jgi:hypothetical protein
MQIDENKLTKIIRKMIAARVLREGEIPNISPTTEQGLNNLSAIRILTIRAEEDSLEFEKIIRKELDLEDPNKMDALSQKVYVQAAREMASKIISAAVDMVKAVEHLPKLPAEGENAAPQVKLNVAK